MAPTRELAQQIEKEVKAFSRSSKGFKASIVVGGANMGDQVGFSAVSAASWSALPSPSSFRKRPP